jgi:hypothetical protein
VPAAPAEVARAAGQGADDDTSSSSESSDDECSIDGNEELMPDAPEVLEHEDESLEESEIRPDAEELAGGAEGAALSPVGNVEAGPGMGSCLDVRIPGANGRTASRRPARRFARSQKSMECLETARVGNLDSILHFQNCCAC